MVHRWICAVLVGFAWDALACAAAEDTDYQIAGVDSALLAEALEARRRHVGDVIRERFVSIIDYRQPSGDPRYFLVDLEAGTADALLVAHGRGSDLDHDGYADQFSNVHGSKMSSLGSFVTGETYYGRHGLSLRLSGLEAQNDQARARAIVIHGADYVSTERQILGRSWGCPALSRAEAQRVIPLIAGGTFVYVLGP